LDEKNLRIPFRIIFEREKTSEFCSESFLEEEESQNSVLNQFSKTENTQKSIPNHFWEQKTLGKRRLLLAAS
jgi:hypothetical protein